MSLNYFLKNFVFIASFVVFVVVQAPVQATTMPLKKPITLVLAHPAAYKQDKNTQYVFRYQAVLMRLLEALAYMLEVKNHDLSVIIMPTALKQGDQYWCASYVNFLQPDVYCVISLQEAQNSSDIFMYYVSTEQTKEQINFKKNLTHDLVFASLDQAHIGALDHTKNYIHIFCMI